MAIEAGPAPHPVLDDRTNRLSESLTRFLRPADDGPQIAVVVTEIWSEIDEALSPVLGRRGVAALYSRSLHLSGPTHLWLSNLTHGSASVIDFEKLKEAFANQDALEATTAAVALLQAFCDLLSSLVGSALTERLLAPVMTHLKAGYPPEAY